MLLDKASQERAKARRELTYMGILHMFHRDPFLLKIRISKDLNEKKTEEIYQCH